MSEKKIIINDGSIQKGGQNIGTSQVATRPPKPTPTRPTESKK
jgi:hypothetical protein